LVGSKNIQRRFKIVLVLVIVVTIGIVLLTFMRYRNNAADSETELSDSQNQASISIGKVHHTATKNGKKEWSLVADSAHYLEKENKALFKNLEVVFYMDDGRQVSLTADRGYLQTESNDIQVEGDVLVDNGTYRFETRSLNYFHQSRRMHTDDPVTVSGEWFTLSADTLSVDLNAQQAEFKGDVKGVLSEDILL
jgi:LPS export ABC transporter protein LptC